MHQLTEVDKCVILAIGSGALGGLIQETIQDIISKVKNQPARSTARRVRSYIYAGFFYGILMGVSTFTALMFDTATPVKDVRQYMIPFAIIGLPLITLSSQLLEPLFFKKQEN